ncbi:PspA/IM30 family protein [Sediminispirochaeta smaragdinae]|uniref:Phage shock protein A, PspA n=1 Tax=Sediminispirochaeta smaragdinae (strain DSM 11293 / JCM 15392 / SEBR 4228) TaxID=573413 RepID=E1R8F5_SEDSS|nr:PspA/IM30 family protein [Sediminispirochaeta smaragdinae]ADK79299.1 phage shock protein A, PspA [Sediminispirochaeta smaragdinae DSM 11293]
MGFFQRFRRMIKSNLNEMISKAEDPEKMLDQVIVDMNRQMIESKKSVAGAIADEKKLERQLNQTIAAAREWEEKAKLAVRAGKDDLAKEALLRKQEYMGEAAQYREQLEGQHDSVEKLKQSLRQLQQKIDEAQRKRNLLIARAKRAKAQQKMQETIKGINQNSAFEAFDRLSEKVDRMEAENEAYEELDAPVKDDLERQFEALEDGSGTSADLLLEDLKQRMKHEEPS